MGIKVWIMFTLRVDYLVTTTLLANQRVLKWYYLLEVWLVVAALRWTIGKSSILDHPPSKLISIGPDENKIAYKPKLISNFRNSIYTMKNICAFIFETKYWHCISKVMKWKIKIILTALFIREREKERKKKNKLIFRKHK